MTAPAGRQHRLFLLFIILAGLAAYGPSAGTYFLKDDLSMRMFTHEDGSFDGKGFWYQLLWPTARTWDDIWRPVPALTWAYDFIVFGPDPFAFHAGNILAHILSGILLYWLFNRWTGFRSLEIGFFAALLFELYPLNPEAIVWCTQRTVVFGLCFLLAALLLFDVYLHRGQRRHLVFAWICAFLSLLSREHALGLPAAFGFMALFFGPSRNFATRWRQAGGVVLAGLGFLALYFAGRFAIFGRLVSGYSGYATIEEYSRDQGVMEKLPTTTRALLVPDNQLLFDANVIGTVTSDMLFLGFQIMVGAIAVVSLVTSRRGSGAWRIAALAILLSLLAWVPVFPVLFIHPSLLNSRSGYHIMATTVSLVGALLGGLSLRGAVPRWRVALAGITVVVYALVLQCNLSSYDHGGREVRGLQEAVVREAAVHGRNDLYAVFSVPGEYLGCPTMDTYLRPALRPPYCRNTIDVFPFSLDQRSFWLKVAGAPEGLVAAMEAHNRPPRAVHFYEALSKAPWLVPMFGAAEPALGDTPPVPIAPGDGALLPCSGAAPVFVFDAGQGTRRFRITLDVPGVRVELPYDEANTMRSGDRITAGLLDTRPPGSAEPIAWPIRGPVAFNPMPVVWRVAVEDSEGRIIARSVSRRLLLIDDRMSR